MEGRNNIQGQETHSGSAWQEQMPLSNSGRSRLMMTTWSAAQPSQQIVKLGIQLHASTYSSFQHKSSTDYFPSFQRVPLKHFSVKTNNVRSNQTTLFLSECLLRLKCQARWVVYYMPVALPVTLYPCATLYVPTCSTTWADYLQTVLPLVGKRPAVFASAFSVLVSFTFKFSTRIVFADSVELLLLLRLRALVFQSGPFRSKVPWCRRYVLRDVGVDVLSLLINRGWRCAGFSRFFKLFCFPPVFPWLLFWFVNFRALYDFRHGQVWLIHFRSVVSAFTLPSSKHWNK